MDVEVVEEVVEAESGGVPMAVLRKRPAGEGAWPKVAMFHDGPGIRSATHDFAGKLAGAGYDVVVPDLYHRHGRMIGYELHEREADPTLVDRLRELMGALTDDGIQADLDAALAAVGVGPAERLGTIGFCLGARAAFRAMERRPDRFVAGAMWHPSFLVDDEPDSLHLTAGALAPPLYVGIGDADEIQSVEMHQPFLDAVAPLDHVEVEIHPGADHGFTWPGWPNYDEAAAERCFARTTALFATHLQAR